MNHEIHEAHERVPGLKIRSPLSVETEVIVTQTIGCAIAVHRALGPGYLESIYKKAMRIELEARGLAYEHERPVSVTYRGIEIPGQRLDLVVGKAVIVELKAVARVEQIHRAQIISYLHTAGLRVGLLINFKVAILPHGLERIVV